MKAHHVLALRVAAAVWLLALGPAHGQQSESTTADAKLSAAEVIKAATVSMPLATAPAAFMLGVSAESVPRLSSFKDFSAQIARAFDEKGRVAHAISAEFAPALAAGAVTWEQIERDLTAKLASRSLVSFATTTTAGGGSRTALGLQTWLWAPALDMALEEIGKGDCLAVIQWSKNAELTPSRPGAALPLAPAGLSKKRADCQAAVNKRVGAWNQPMVAVGFGKVFRTTPTTSEEPATPNPTAFWLTAAFGNSLQPVSAGGDAPSPWLLTAHLRHTRRAQSTDRLGATVAANESLLGLNGRWGGKRLAGIAEWSVTRSRASGHAFDARRKAVLAMEYMVADDLYFTLGVGHDSALPANKRSALARLNWGFGKSLGL